MLDDIRKGLLAGLGMVLLTKEKIEEQVRKLVDEAKMNKEEARRFTEELVANGEKQWTELDRNITETVRKGFDHLDVGSRKELEELKARLGNLEKRVGMLEKPQSPIEE